MVCIERASVLECGDAAKWSHRFDVRNYESAQQFGSPLASSTRRSGDYADSIAAVQNRADLSCFRGYQRVDQRLLGPVLISPSMENLADSA
jgi:hypothetical protein